MLARVLEASGLSTVQISMVREHTEQVKPPRALWVPFPFGSALGRADDPEFQHRVLGAALTLFERDSGPVLEEFRDDGGLNPAQNPVSRAGETVAQRDVAFEVTRIRSYHESFVQAHGRTSVGLSRVPPTRFRGPVRMLEAYAAGQTVEPVVPIEGVSLSQYIRWACDDLKALYVEARLAQRSQASGPEIMAWFWEDTLAGDLVRAVRDRMDLSDDPRDKAIAYGIARS